MGLLGVISKLLYGVSSLTVSEYRRCARGPRSNRSPTVGLPSRRLEA